MKTLSRKDQIDPRLKTSTKTNIKKKGAAQQKANRITSHVHPKLFFVIKRKRTLNNKNTVVKHPENLKLTSQVKSIPLMSRSIKNIQELDKQKRVFVICV